MPLCPSYPSSRICSHTLHSPQTKARNSLWEQSHLLRPQHLKSSRWAHSPFLCACRGRENTSVSSFPFTQILYSVPLQLAGTCFNPYAVITFQFVFHLTSVVGCWKGKKCLCNYFQEARSVLCACDATFTASQKSTRPTRGELLLQAAVAGGRRDAHRMVRCSYAGVGRTSA